MKQTFYSLPAGLLATAAAAHESAHAHAHVTDPNWMPLTAGLLMIGVVGLIAWTRK